MTPSRGADLGVGNAMSNAVFLNVLCPGRHSYDLNSAKSVHCQPP
jgi:hypothetical protein